MPARGWVEINEMYCKACETCVTDCPSQVLALDMSRLSPKGYPSCIYAAPGAMHWLRHLCCGLPRCRHYGLSRRAPKAQRRRNNGQRAD